MTDIQAAIAAKPGPKVTAELVESRIVGEEFHTFGTLTICILSLVNGFQVTGESACVSPENFDLAIGEKLARAKAVDRIFAMEAYVLANRVMLEQALGGVPCAGGRDADDYVGMIDVRTIPADDIEKAKSLIRLALEPGDAGKARLNEVLALLSPTSAPITVFSGTAFEGILDGTIEEIRTQLADLSDLDLRMLLAAEERGKTRKGAVYALLREMTDRAAVTPSDEDVQI